MMRLGSIILALAACTRVPLGEGERRKVAGGIVADVIIPSLQATAAAVHPLEDAVTTFALTRRPSTLARAQEVWRMARARWKTTEAFAFGPASDLRLGVAIDQWPIDPAKIDADLAGSETLDEVYVDSIGANRKGYHAIEYLIFRRGDNAAVIASFEDALGPRRRALLVALAQNLDRKMTQLEREWLSDYAALLSEPARGNPRYQTIKAVIDTLVNECVFLAEWIADTRLGKPMGTASGGTPQPDLEESGPSDNSTADMIGSLQGIRNVYLGSVVGMGDDGIGKLVAASSPGTDAEVRAALDRALGAVAQIPLPYAAALTERRSEVQAAYDAVKELKRVLGTEVLAVLGATLKFNDNDGD